MVMGSDQNEDPVGLGNLPDGAVGDVLESAKEFAGRIDPAPLEGLADHTARIVRVISELGAAYTRIRQELEATWIGPSADAAVGALAELTDHSERIRSFAADVNSNALNAVGVARYTKNRTTDLPGWQPSQSEYGKAQNRENASAAQDHRYALESGLLHLAGMLASAIAAAGGPRRLPSRSELLRSPYEGMDFRELSRRARADSKRTLDAVHDPMAETLPLGSRATPGTFKARPGLRTESPAVLAWQLSGVIDEDVSTGSPREGLSTASSHELALRWLEQPAAGGAEPSWPPPTIGDARNADPWAQGRPHIISAYDYEPRRRGDPR